MANRQRQSPGGLRRFEESGRISGDVPSFAVETGAASRALAESAGALSATLGGLADKAAAREGELAGLNAGASSGAAYLKMQAASAAAAPPGKPSERMAAAKAYLMQTHGLKAHQAEGIVGNLMQESSLNTGARNPGDGRDGTDSIGIAQWNSGRARALHAFAGSKGKAVDDFHLQLDFVMHELAGSEGAAGRALAAATTVEEATAAFIGFERPLGWTPENPRGGHAWDNRLKYARQLGGMGGDPAPGAPAAPAPAAANAPVVPVLPSTPLALRRDGTIRGEAYDNAARNAHAWRMQSAVEAQISAAAIEHPDDPAALAASLAKVQDSFLKDPTLADPYMREAFTKNFVEKSQADLLAAQARATTKLRAEETVAAQEGIAAIELGIERQAVSLGASAEGDAIITRELAKGGRSIDAAVASGALTPAQASDAKERLAQKAARGRIQGVYDALATPAAKEQYAIGLLEEWKNQKGPLANLPYETAKALSDTLFNDARTAIGRQTTEQKIEAASLERLIADDLTSIGASGKGLDPASGLTADRVATLLGPEKLAAWQQARETANKAWQATAGMDADSPAEMASRVQVLAEAAKRGGAGAADAQVALAAATDRMKTVIEARGKDPLGQMHAAGAVQLEPIDFTSPERMGETLAKRHADASTVATITGEPRTFFRPSERAFLARSLGDNPLLFPEFALQLNKVFGDDAGKALAEISEDAPVMAHAAGLQLATGNGAVATDVAQALAAKQAGKFTAKMPEAGKLANAAGAAIGSAMAYLPGIKASTVATANLLFELEANRTGFDPKDVDEPGTPAAEAYQRSIDKALGASTVNGVRQGGIGEVNGYPVIVPPDMPTERPQELLESLTEEQLEFLPAIMAANGVPVTAAQLRAAHLVSHRDGVYRVMLGDPEGDAPRRVLGADGKDWLLDIRQLDRWRAGQFGRPSNARGDDPAAFQ